MTSTPPSVPRLGSDGTLTCPFCAFTNLMRNAVDVYQRDQISGKTQHSHIPYNVDGVVRVDGDLRSSPSRQQSGMRIRFWCDNCERHLSLCFVNEWSKTTMRWEEERKFNVEPPLVVLPDLPRGHWPITMNESPP